MKKHITSKLFAAWICATTLFAVSCSNDTETLTISPGTAAGFKEIRDKALANLTQTKVFKAEDGITFESQKGAMVTIHGNCLRDASNNLVSGDVSMSFIEIYDKGNMVMTNKPVMGKDNSGNKLPLVTGGQFNLEIKQGDKILKPGCTFYVDIPASNTGALDNDMTLWLGNIDEQGNLEWDEVGRDQQKDGGLNPNMESSSYSIWGTHFGWTNVDRFYNDPRPKTQIKVTVPAGYSNNNSGVYLAYQGEPNVLAQLDTYDTVEKYFSEHYGFLPIGLKVHVIFVSESNGSVVYAIKPATIVNNGTIAINSSDLATSTLNNVINLISNLN